MQVDFFGSHCPSGLFIPCWAKPITMTAYAITFSRFGFAVAADGRQPWGNTATRDDFIARSESYAAQKIFGFKTKNYSFAYLVRGAIANRERTFDLSLELERYLNLHLGNVGPYALIQQAAIHLEQYIQFAMERHTVPVFPTTFIDFVGYIRQKEFWIKLQYHPHTELDCLFLMSVQDILPGMFFWTGSQVVWDMIAQDKPPFASFCNGFNRNKTLDGALGYAEGYVRACCSKEARQFDPECEIFGGHIHTATIIPDGGFHWAIPPLRDATTI